MLVSEIDVKVMNQVERTAVHARIHELNLGPALLVLSTNETVPLVYTLCSVYWKDLCLISEDLTMPHHEMAIDGYLHMPSSPTHTCRQQSQQQAEMSGSYHAHLQGAA